MRNLFLMIALPLLVVACDSAQPDSQGTPVPTPPTTVPTTPTAALQAFGFAPVPERITVDVPDTYSVSLASYLNHTAPSGLRVAASVGTSESDGPATATVISSSLSVRAVREGVSALRLSFSAPGYRDTTLTVQLVSRVRCPPAAAPGSVDYVPALDGGSVRTFAYSGTFTTRTGSSRREGTVRAEVVGTAICYRGSRSVPVVYTFTSTGSGPATTFRETASIVEDSAGVVSLPVLAVSYGEGTRTATLQRYGAPGSDPVRLARVDVPPNCATTYRFEAGIGFTEDAMPSCYHGSGWYESWPLRRTGAR